MLLEVGLPERSAPFPLDLPLLGVGERLAHEPVTLLVGENGNGKSTLLEALALACELPAAGSRSHSHDETLTPVRPLADKLNLAWTHRTRQGLFFRAEDYFGFVKAQNRMRAELRDDLARLSFENLIYPKPNCGGSVRPTAARWRRPRRATDATSTGRVTVKVFWRFSRDA